MFIPKILFYGDIIKLTAELQEYSYEITGQLKISKGTFFVNDKAATTKDILKILSSDMADYIICTNLKKWEKLQKHFSKNDCHWTTIITVEQFKQLSCDFYYDIENSMNLLCILQQTDIRTLFDLDGYFLEAKHLTKGNNNLTEIETVTDKDIYPVKNNIYSRVWKRSSDIANRHYDAVLISNCNHDNFKAITTRIWNVADKVIVFCKKYSMMEEYIKNTLSDYKEVTVQSVGLGKWYLLTLQKFESVCIYSIAHNKIVVKELPSGYAALQAGASAYADIGCLKDNTENNISDLNVFINEITGLFWIWKNTNDDYVGLCHYRRFLTTDTDNSYAFEKIVTDQQVKELLKSYDILIGKAVFFGMTQKELLINDCDENLAHLGLMITERYLSEIQPDYLESFNYVWTQSIIWRSHLFITRHYVFNAYCSWLFSFFIEATKEVIQAAALEEQEKSSKRLMGYIGERMLSVWLYKQNLRIKELSIMQIE